MSITPLDRPIRLGVYIDQIAHVGGGYQQTINAGLLTKEIPTGLCQIFFFTSIKKNIVALKKYGINAQFIHISRWVKLLFIINKFIRKKTSINLKCLNRFEKYFSDFKIDLIYFLSPSQHVTYLTDTNYIITVWDLCHRDNPEFPEVRCNCVFESREEFYQRVLPKAVAIISDSRLGKRNIVQRYGIDKEKIHVISFSPALATTLDSNLLESYYFDVKKKYSIEWDYIFYPAQLWPHKNHVYIIESLYLLEKELGKKIGAVFSGNDVGGNLNYLKQACQKLGLEERVRFVGFVDNDAIPNFYTQSIGLVMPTYFGPTNLPPLEAFTLGVPVIYPDVPGLREQVGDAALLVDLRDPMSLANALSQLLEDEPLRMQLIKNGKQRTRENLNELRVNKLINIIENFKIKRKCWN